MAFTSIQQAMDAGKGKVSIRGWCHRERGSGKLKFIVLRDSTNVIQCIVKNESASEELWKDAESIAIEDSMEIHGIIKKDERAPTGYEVEVENLRIVGKCLDPFPITKDQSEEYLRDVRHLWLRSRKLTAIMKIRSAYIQARDEFYRTEGFHRFDTPILQPSQSEGGSTLFEVKYYKDITYLAQTWQLYAEAGIFSLERMYNMGPTFRAEKSNTSRHLSEFWMAEMEAAWFQLPEVTEFAKKEVKFCVAEAVKRCPEDFKSLGRDPEAILKMTKREWPTIKYREALKILEDKKKMKVTFGKDLRTVEEENLMSCFDTPVVVTHYPVEAMAFYKPRDPDFPDEALCFDMLAPECGIEIVGGSERSLDVEDMKTRLKEMYEDPEDYQWYFDLRKYGSVPHSGYGVGIERVIQWICGLDNIKDAIPFPRTQRRFKP